MPDKRYFLIFIVLLGLLGLCKKLFFDSCKDIRRKKKIFAALSIFNVLLFAGFFWSMMEFKFYWTIFLLFFLPAFAFTVLNILTTAFCESCGTINQNLRFWKPAKECMVCRKAFTN
jgi:UDP-N-acetylmuramyl pentapeptide phosphotransferase/UDP-N-acetylglucosamine-1-phosphate transferase